MCTEIDNDENKLYEEANRIIEEDNEKYLNEIDEKIDELELRTSTDKKFERLLSEIKEIDEQINKEFLNEGQKEKYEYLKNDLIEAQEAKIFKDNKNVIWRYRGVLKDFKADENRYIKKVNVNKLEQLLKPIFSINKNNLFDETIVYYNYIYQYIFSKVDDELKFEMTKWAVESNYKEYVYCV